MMKYLDLHVRKSILIVGMFFLYTAYAQAPDAYIVTFTDKDNSTYSIDNPHAFLSDRAIAKRMRLNIPIMEEDIPISENYIGAIEVFEDITVLAKSKWMNYIVIQCNNPLLLQVLEYLPFVNQVEKIHLVDYSQFEVEFSNPAYNYTIDYQSQADTSDLSYYGLASEQIKVHNGQFLHRNGYRGENMLIVMLDNGYNSLDVMTYFDDLRNEGRLLGTYDAAHQANYNIYRSGDHGTKVLSVMALDEPYDFVGVAPKADYFLIRTEMDTYEDLLEEFFWVVGAEFADSLGADVINSSLGYSRFDKPEQNHSFSSLDGKQSVASIAATKLAQKGCVVAIAAGNEGDKEWHYISIPSDAPDALCVAAMNADSLIGNFSSRGSSSFLYVKPDVTAVGWQTAFCTTADTLDTGNGTSLATPVITGLCACLWQAFPHKTSLEIMDAVRRSAHLYNHADTLFGYGIPDFKKAYLLLVESGITEKKQAFNIQLYPNPAHDNLTVFIDSDVAVSGKLKICDLSARVLIEKFFDASLVRLDLSVLARGMYFIQIQTEKQVVRSLKFIKL